MAGGTVDVWAEMPVSSIAHSALRRFDLRQVTAEDQTVGERESGDRCKKASR
jgi:hypothetical protein